MRSNTRSGAAKDPLCTDEDFSTGLRLLPLAIGTGSAGKEIEGPLAIVILGGLATSTLLNLLVLPTLSLRFGRFSKNNLEEE